MTKLTYELTGKPPIWAENAEFYYINVHGEQWIAKISDDMVSIAGSDIGWEEIELLPSDVGKAYQITTGTIEKEEVDLDLLSNNPLTKWTMNKGEHLWLASVLYIAIERFNYLALK